jgi:AAA15 family ATPase/GTPase
MLIRFTCENFLSFTEETEFLNTANTRSTKLKDHIIRSKPSHIPILKTTAIYGANASGKSNFLEAIIFSKNIVASYKKDITDHRISSHQSKFSQTSDSKFEYEFKSENLVFRYGFIINQTQVKAEWLYQKSIVATSAEKTIFTRKNQSIDNQEEIKNIIKKETSDDHFFDYCAKGLRPEQLFLHKLKDNNIKFVDQIFDWFNSIKLFDTKTTIDDFTFRNIKAEQFVNIISATLLRFDSNISDIILEEITEINKPTDIKLTHLESFKNDLAEALYDNLKTLNNYDLTFFFSYVFIKEEDKIKQKQLFIIRNGQKFSLQEESDGINRLLDLTMILFYRKNTIWLIDELEKSLHPYLAKLFIEFFFYLSKNKENQLIFTTHLPYLLNLDLLRKDEIWFVEKDKNMNSIIKSLAEYKLNDAKKGLDIEKQYLQGRFGVVPFISSSFFK